MNQAFVSRVNPWLLVAIVATVLVLAAMLVLVTQPDLIHTMGTMLHGARQFADPCPGAASSSC